MVLEESVPLNICLEELNPCVKESIVSHDFLVKLSMVTLSLREVSGENESELLIVSGKSLFGFSGIIIHAVAHQSPEMCRR